MNTTRRSFLGGALLAPIGARLFAGGGKPLFRFGVMTDTHIGQTVESCGRVKLALELFREKDCELVINTGDIAEGHYPTGYQAYRQVFDEVYAGAERKPGEIYVYAWHDVKGYKGHAREMAVRDAPEAFEEVRRLLKAPNSHTDTVVHKGYTFVVFPQFAGDEGFIGWDEYEKRVAAACAAKESGAERVLVIERDDAPGGILQQCIHNGFGLHRFKEELTGPEYAQRFVDRAEELEIPVVCGTMVLDIAPQADGSSKVTAMSPRGGLKIYRTRSVVLAMGCRERPRGALMTPGTRPAGVYTAGTVQRLVNMDGIMPGKRVVILGSGDIGLIMARRLTFSGAKVLACIEIMKKSSGLMRNVVQCLNDYDIPLLLSHTVTDVEGREHVTGVKVSKVDENLKPIPGTEMHFDCDTLVLSCGLIPENELTKKAGIEMDPKTRGPKVDPKTMATSVPGIFAGGNVVRVYDLVDWVSRDSEIAGKSAAEYVKGMAK